MRAPAFGAPRNILFQAALDQVAWADQLGFDVVELGEHHCSDDGYNPSPLPLACAMAAPTKQIKPRTSVLLGIGAGYRPSEFESFNRRLDDRWQVMGDICRFLRQAWTGKSFEWQGRSCIVTPRPEPFAPPTLLGGSSAAAACAPSIEVCGSETFFRDSPQTPAKPAILKRMQNASISLHARQKRARRRRKNSRSWESVLLLRAISAICLKSSIW
jgi:alkanesulfonate monooxygenase SsuD/methylene tetrahydromethanopterin reductase-like flavin-dependent oxidoreductase (luciferase family)